MRCGVIKENINNYGSRLGRLNFKWFIFSFLIFKQWIGTKTKLALNSIKDYAIDFNFIGMYGVWVCRLFVTLTRSSPANFLVIARDLHLCRMKNEQRQFIVSCVSRSLTYLWPCRIRARAPCRELAKVAFSKKPNKIIKILMNNEKHNIFNELQIKKKIWSDIYIQVGSINCIYFEKEWLQFILRHINTQNLHAITPRLRWHSLEFPNLKIQITI